MLHYAQTSKYDDFILYDYGSLENQKRYGQANPPSIDLGKIRVPTAMIVGVNDEECPVKHGRWTKARVKSVVSYREIDNFDHSSFSIGKDMSYFDKVLGLIQQYN